MSTVPGYASAQADTQAGSAGTAAVAFGATGGAWAGRSAERGTGLSLDAISFGKPAMTYEGRGDGGEGEEVFRLALV
ncbi:hypothetical protein, partial [Streptomyces sp. NPDC051129]|uniref:hypothetical protein n=1 Tax=Streptomyces sp. NPDC051129 TaxID=3154639 RepID=UPI00343BB6AB